MKKTVKPIVVKRSRIRAIDQGTEYDVPGRMIRRARAIRGEQIGKIRGVIITEIYGSGDGIQFTHTCVGPAPISDFMRAAERTRLNLHRLLEVESIR